MYRLLVDGKPLVECDTAEEAVRLVGCFEALRTPIVAAVAREPLIVDLPARAPKPEPQLAPALSQRQIDACERGKSVRMLLLDVGRPMHRRELRAKLPEMKQHTLGNALDALIAQGMARRVEGKYGYYEAI